ncbi:MAG: hypothetical protein LBE13_03575, partial [Bacteroidales bacterium]|nr:hypothetical protein [Bacteroidales bacterium]
MILNKHQIYSIYINRYYRIIADILVTVMSVTVLCTIFIVNKDYVYSMIVGKYFWFYASMSLFSIIAIQAVIIRCKERLSFEISDLLILLFCIATVLITLNHIGRLTNKCLLLIFATLFYFYLRIFLSDKNKLIYSLCSMAFVATSLVEAVWGVMQLYGFTSSQHNLFKITGSFFNPGPYSGWLAMVFPMALGYSIFNHKGHEVTQSF